MRRRHLGCGKRRAHLVSDPYYPCNRIVDDEERQQIAHGRGDTARLQIVAKQHRPLASIRLEAIRWCAIPDDSRRAVRPVHRQCDQVIANPCPHRVICRFDMKCVGNDREIGQPEVESRIAIDGLVSLKEWIPTRGGNPHPPSDSLVAPKDKATEGEAARNTPAVTNRTRITRGSVALDGINIVGTRHHFGNPLNNLSEDAPSERNMLGCIEGMIDTDARLLGLALATRHRPGGFRRQQGGIVANRGRGPREH